MTVDVYRPELWHDFFLMVGGGAAALAGLVFVAMSLNLDAIVRDTTHRNRSRGTLAGFMAAFSTCALVLMGGQDHWAVGVEWLLTAGVGAVIYVQGFVEAFWRRESRVGLHPFRLIAGTALYTSELIGAILLMLGYLRGLYVAAIAMVALMAFMISGAWLLVVGVEQPKTKQRSKA